MCASARACTSSAFLPLRALLSPLQVLDAATARHGRVPACDELTGERPLSRSVAPRHGAARRPRGGSAAREQLRRRRHVTIALARRARLGARGRGRQRAALCTLGGLRSLRDLRSHRNAHSQIPEPQGASASSPRHSSFDGLLSYTSPGLWPVDQRSSDPCRATPRSQCPSGQPAPAGAALAQRPGTASHRRGDGPVGSLRSSRDFAGCSLDPLGLVRRHLIMNVWAGTGAAGAAARLRARCPRVWRSHCDAPFSVTAWWSGVPFWFGLPNASCCKAHARKSRFRRGCLW